MFDICSDKCKMGSAVGLVSMAVLNAVFGGLVIGFTYKETAEF